MAIRTIFPGLARKGACAAALTVTMALAGNARADDARVEVAAPGRAYAPPPTRPESALVVVADTRDDGEPSAREARRAAMRVHVGPLAATSGAGLGAGLGVATDFGRGSLGVRFAAAWLRGEPRSDGAMPSRLGDGFGQYTGELTVDLHKRGPWHPIAGMGFGGACVYTGEGSGWIGVGVGRLALEYAVGLDDADVRIAAGVTGAMAGPADRELRDVRGWLIGSVSLGVGF